MQEKIVLIGAGSAVFARGLIADLILQNHETELALADVNRESLAFVVGLARKMLTARKSSIRLSSSTDPRDVLKDATAVICTVGVGGRRAWEQDVFTPRKFGIFQPVGDSVMPGGTSRALRMVPAMTAIARDVLDLAPQALFFNYGNPMAPICRGIHKATGAGVVGLCHGVNHVGHYLAETLGVPLNDFTYTAVGMNHLTWFTELHARGEDVLPRLQDIARQRGARAPSGGTDPEKESPFSWHLCRLFGAFPAVLDRHVVEFFPWFFPQGRYYGRTLGVDCYSFENTIANGDRLFSEMRELALSQQPLPEDYFQRIGGEHEQVVEIIASIRRGERRVYSVNLPNGNRCPNLPPEAILEGPAIADGGTLKPIIPRPLTPGLAGTLATRMAWVETVVDAALDASREKFIQALVLDGAVPALAVAEQLADALLAAQAEHLPQFRKLK